MTERLVAHLGIAVERNNLLSSIIKELVAKCATCKGRGTRTNVLSWHYEDKYLMPDLVEVIPCPDCGEARERIKDYERVEPEQHSL